MYPLTRQELEAERLESQQEDATYRLDSISSSLNDCLAACRVAIQQHLAETVAQGNGNTVDPSDLDATLSSLQELLEESTYPITSDLRDMQNGEGRHDIASLREDHEESQWESRRERREDLT